MTTKAHTAAYVGQLINIKFGRDDELESDKLGIRFMVKSGYNPEALIGVMKILSEASNGNTQPEFFSTHPNPGNRISEIKKSDSRIISQWASKRSKIIITAFLLANIDII